MTRSELIERLAIQSNGLSQDQVASAVRVLLQQMTEALACGDYIEIRGFGSFSTHERPPRQGRNPKTGEPVALGARQRIRFKPGKAMRERVDQSKAASAIHHAA